MLQSDVLVFRPVPNYAPAVLYDLVLAYRGGVTLQFGTIRCRIQTPVDQRQRVLCGGPSPLNLTRQRLTHAVRTPNSPGRLDRRPLAATGGMEQTPLAALSRHGCPQR